MAETMDLKNVLVHITDQVDNYMPMRDKAEFVLTCAQTSLKINEADMIKIAYYLCQFPAEKLWLKLSAKENSEPMHYPMSSPEEIDTEYMNSIRIAEKLARKYIDSDGETQDEERSGKVQELAILLLRTAKFNNQETQGPKATWENIKQENLEKIVELAKDLKYL